MKAGLYARVSSEEQTRGHSIGEQFAAMRRFCQDRGWTIAAEYSEPAITASTGDRPVLQEALADCQAGRIDVLLTHQLDRFYRNLRLQLETMEQLDRWGIVYVSVVENIDFSSPHGRMVAGIMGSINQYFLENLGRETQKGKRGRAKKGLSNAPYPPHGYHRIDGKDRIDPKTAPAVILAFETYAAGQHSDQQIAELLASEGHKPHRYIKTGRWTRDTVQHMLRNRFYIGEIRYHDGWLPGQHKPIIDAQLFDQVQAVRDERRRRGSGGPGTGRAYLLQRIARCWHCRRPLHMVHMKQDGRRYEFFRDSAGIANVDCPAAGRHIPQDIINDQVAELVKRLSLPSDWRERLKELVNHRQEQDQVEGKRQYLQGKLRRLREMYLDGDIEKPEYNHRKADLQAQLNAQQLPEQLAIETAGETLESLGTAWAGAPLRLQRDMLRVIFEAVYVDMLSRRLVCVKPYKQFAPLFVLDGLEEVEDGCFYREARKAGSTG